MPHPWISLHFWLHMLFAVLMVSYKIEWQTKNVDEGCNCLGGWIYINLLLVKITIEYAMNLLFLG